MKKFVFMMVALGLVVSMLAGCNSGNTDKIKTYTDATQTIDASVNQEFIIAVDSNPTTGYDWEESYDSDMLSLTDDRYEPDEKAAGLVGAGGTQYFRFKALKAGQTEITVTYKRSWETDIAEQKVFNINIK